MEKRYEATYVRNMSFKAAFRTSTVWLVSSVEIRTISTKFFMAMKFLVSKLIFMRFVRMSTSYEASSIVFISTTRLSIFVPLSCML